MRFHALAGLPRAGSTLLANLLAQHPDVHVSPTSVLPRCIEAVQDVVSNAPEFKSELVAIPGTAERIVGVYRAMIDSWYAHTDCPVVIDKARGWVMHQRLLAQIDPYARIVGMVRDPRDVIASIIRQDARTAMFNSSLGRTVEDICTETLGPQGMVGGPIRFCEDAIRRKAPVVWVRYESFVVDPLAATNRLGELLGLSPHPWDVESVENIAADVDGIYLHKFPHEGSGPIKPSSTTWRDVFHDEIAQRIAISYPLFMQTFAYQET